MSRLDTAWLALVGALAATGCHSEAPACALVPELDAGECAAVQALLLPPDLPPARGNAHGDDPGAAQLGFAIFYDARFSSNQNLRCATCHPPERRFQDGIPTAKGLGPLPRNTPTLLNAARYTWLFWDGRADSIWAQALTPLENPAEMGFTRLALAHRIAMSYRASYEAVFGPLPALDDLARFPESGAPGDPAFDQMAPADREEVNRLTANVGKAFEAYQRKLATGPAPLDRFLAGDPAALTAAQRRGLIVFVRAGCIGCHAGPLLSDQQFHDLGVPTLPGATPDRGRAEGLERLAADPFNAQGPYRDGPRPEPPSTPTPADVGAFRTQSLRNVARSAPYGHDGRFATLREMVDFHLAGGGRGAPGVLGTVDALLQRRALLTADEDDLLSLFDALNGSLPLPPWNDWPDR
jgi:cytochrome c peroxidase